MKKSRTEIVKVQQDIIYLLLNHKEAIEKVVSANISAAHFDDDFQHIVSYILELYETHSALLTRKAFRDSLNNYSVAKEAISKEISFDSCFISKSDINDLPLLIKKIIDYRLETSIIEVLDKFKHNKAKHGNFFAIKELSEKTGAIISNFGVDQEDCFYNNITSLSKDKIEYIEKFIKGEIVEAPHVVTGIKEIDYTMATGLEIGTLTLFCSDVGSYKSTMMLNIAMNVWQSGYDVLFVPLEMHRDQMWRKAMARDARINSRLLISDMKKLTEANLERIREVEKQWEEYGKKAQFFIMQEPGNTTVVSIKKVIEKNISRIKPRLVVIDYVANLEAHKNRYGRNDLEIGDMLKSMRQMGKDLGFAVISGAQLGRDALKRLRKAGAMKEKTSINSEDIRGSHEYAADADNIYAQMKSSSQPNELLELFCVKARNGTTTFEDDSIKAILDVFPQFGFIRSQVLGAGMGDVDDIIGTMIDKSDSTEVTKNVKTFEDEFGEMFNSSPKDNHEDFSEIINSIEKADDSEGSNKNKIDDELEW